MDKEMLFKSLIDAVKKEDVFLVSIIEADKIETDTAFRSMCESNSCGMYNKCYMCPPDVGDINVLMKEIGNYRYALVYQTVTALEDSFDFEGMVEAKKKTYPIAQALRKVFDNENIEKVLHLGAGGCGVCEKCFKQLGKPCPFPEKALPSLEAYGINVSSLAKTAGMKYINGQNTVTYFGAVLFSVKE